MEKIPYTKPSFSAEQHLALLQQRGLIVSNPDHVLHFLKFIGYYRLSGYALPFQICEENFARSKHTFKSGTTFEMILDLYIFDRELRLIVMDAIERVEVAVRACIANSMCESYGAHWFMDSAHFGAGFDHSQFISDLKSEMKLDGNGELPKSKDVFLRHYFQKYSAPELPPSWMISEILTIGKWSILYKHIRPITDQAMISGKFGINYKIFTSWLHSLTYLRNLCAHHSRLWNRRFAIHPRIMESYRMHMEPNHTFCAQAVMLHILLKRIATDSHWAVRLSGLMAKHPAVPIEGMGFKVGWEKDPFWI
ncbi:MAG: Abi family protein [Verrucomicrobia bacterium]|nr:Abi family protein [Verrucomicrobiota bacterium]